MPSPELALPSPAPRWTLIALSAPPTPPPRVEVRFEPAPEAPAPQPVEVVAAPSPAPIALPEPAAPRSPEASRVLVSLLARLWLLSNAPGRGGAVASPVLSPPELAAPTPRPPVPAAPETRVPEPPEPPEREVPSAPSPPSQNNGFPRSGLGEFMVEVAKASELPVTTGPNAPVGEVQERVTVMIELPRQLHCRRFMEEKNLISRDKCHLFDRIEKPEPQVAR